MASKRQWAAFVRLRVTLSAAASFPGSCRNNCCSCSQSFLTPHTILFSKSCLFLSDVLLSLTLSLSANWTVKKRISLFHSSSLHISTSHHLWIWTTALLMSYRCLSSGSAAAPLGGLQPSLFPVDLAKSFIPSPPPNMSKLINRPQSPRERKASPSSLPTRLSRALSLGTIPSISRAGTLSEPPSDGK